MGTSTPWEGPKGTSGVKAWSKLGERFDSSDPAADAEAFAATCVDALHETCRLDPSAFRLQDVTRAAGERLTEAMETLAVQGPSGLESHQQDGADADPVETFLEGLVRQLAGDGCSVADAAVRRAAVTTGRRLLKEHPDLHEAISSSSGGAGSGLASDILCSLYQWFFADVIGEFLKTALAENIKLAIPVLALQSPGEGIADHIADRIVKLVPNPCERAAEAAESAQAADALEAAADGDAVTVPVARVAKGLVFGTVRTVLGLPLGEEATS